MSLKILWLEGPGMAGSGMAGSGMAGDLPQTSEVQAVYFLPNF